MKITEKYQCLWTIILGTWNPTRFHWDNIIQNHFEINSTTLWWLISPSNRYAISWVDPFFTYFISNSVGHSLTQRILPMIRYAYYTDTTTYYWDSENWITPQLPVTIHCLSIVERFSAWPSDRPTTTSAFRVLKDRILDGRNP